MLTIMNIVIIMIIKIVLTEYCHNYNQYSYIDNY